MSGYGQFCPVARAAELFAERWTPLIVRELVNGSTHFCELQRGLPRISRTLLAQRLVTLQSAGIVEKVPSEDGHGHEYVLTASGRELGPVVQALGAWGYKWFSRELGPENLDPALLLWFMRRRIRVENLPDERVVIRFKFRGAGRQVFWLVLERPEVDLCLTDPGFGVDVFVDANVKALTQVFLGHLTLSGAVRRDLVRLEGRPAYRRALSDWIGISGFAPSGRSPDPVRRAAAIRV